MTYTQDDIASIITANSTYHPAWIRQQLDIVGSPVAQVINSDRYDTVVARHASRAPLTRVEAEGAATLVMADMADMAVRKALNSFRATRGFRWAHEDRLREFVAIVIGADVVARQEGSV